MSRLWDETTSTAYTIFSAVIVLFMLVVNSFQALSCNSMNPFNNILISTTSTFACWIIFIFVVYNKEYFRMCFANVFGYLATSTTLQQLLPLIVNPNVVDTGILQQALKQINSEHNNTKEQIKPEDIGNILSKELIKIPINDNLHLLSYLRSGTNFVYSLLFIRNYTNVYFKTEIQNTIDELKKITDNITPQTKQNDFQTISNIVSNNQLLLQLLNTIYFKDIIGEIILFILAGIMCIYLNNYLISKINCNYKTKQQIETSIDQYNEIYNYNKSQTDKQIVVSL